MKQNQQGNKTKQNFFQDNTEEAGVCFCIVISLKKCRKIEKVCLKLYNKGS